MNIVILNTGCANLASIKFSIEKLGYYPIISNEKKIILNADKIFLPGVGTAKTAMQTFQYYGLINVISSLKISVFGICLGMQLFGKKSNENNGIKTLNIVNKSVRLLKNHGFPIPHMGWNKIYFNDKNQLFQNIKKESYFYFAHSYVMPINKFTISYCEYGEKFTAAIQKNNFFGVQFHPERSGHVGLQLLKNFLEI